MRLSMGYPDRDSQVALMKERHHSNPLDQLKAVVDIPELRKLIVDTAEVYVADEIYGYVTDLAEASRHQEYIQLGVSPRGALAVCRTAKANSFLKGRDYVLPGRCRRSIFIQYVHIDWFCPQRRGFMNTLQMIC